MFKKMKRKKKGSKSFSNHCWCTRKVRQPFTVCGGVKELNKLRACQGELDLWTETDRQVHPYWFYLSHKTTCTIDININLREINVFSLEAGVVQQVLAFFFLTSKSKLQLLSPIPLIFMTWRFIRSLFSLTRYCSIKTNLSRTLNTKLS